MTMEAFAIVIGIIKLDGLRCFSHILHVHMPQPAQLSQRRSVKYVICVTGVTGLIARNASVLKMRCGNIRGVVDPQAFSVWFHDVTRKAELGLFRTLHMFSGAH